MADSANMLELKAKMARDPEFAAKLIVNPKKALEEAKIELEDEGDVTTVELFAKLGQQNVRAASALLDVEAARADWGIGASCCNDKAVLPAGRPMARFKDT